MTTSVVLSSLLWGVGTWSEPPFKTTHDVGKDDSPKQTQDELKRKYMQDSQNTSSHSDYTSS